MKPATRTLTLTAGALATVLALAGCSGAGSMSGMEGMDDGSSASPSESESTAAFNDADVMFAQMMVVHHTEAIDMADTVLAKEGVDERVSALAERIKAAQQPEIEQMNALLEEWGASEAPMDMDMQMDDMGMSEEDMMALEEAPGQEANRLFLEQMIVHHESAIQMAEDEVESGENPEATELAQKIIDDQSAEIEEIRSLIDSL